MHTEKVRIGPPNRREQLVRWVESWCDGVAFTLYPLSGGASARNFFRLELADNRPALIVRDAPAHGDSHRFVRVARLLADAGVHAPDVIAQNLEQGFLLISDLGDASYLSELNNDNANSLFEAAIDALIRWQLASRAGVLPAVDEELLRSEMDLFAEWYVERHLGMRLGSAERRAFEDVVATIVARNLSQPTVYVHRDYTARNLMVCDLIPGVLDFQDAMLGPVTYDVASLFWTSSHDWPERRVRHWTVRYWEKARSAGVPIQDRIDEFREDLQWTSVQRHLKVLGVFARLKYRDDKRQYIKNSPRLVRHIRAVAVRYDALAPLLQMLDRRGDAALN
jgi:aminoglycoside/choline kinase family phosphotransferase